MRVALDTSILVYAEGVNGSARALQTQVALDALAEDDLVVAVQALGELFTVLTRKAKWSPKAAQLAVLAWQDACLVIDTTPSLLQEAMEVAAAHQYALWDAIMLAAAAQAGCRVLLSEDMQAGFIWRGTEVRNPFVQR